VDTLAIVLIFAALLVGGIVGWLVGAREAAGAKRTTEALRLQLDGVVEERDSARGELDEMRKEAHQLSLDKTRLEQDAINFNEQKRLLLEAQEALKREFESAGNKVLEKAQEAFLNRAQERFAQSEEKSAERIQTLLAPVGERLKSYEEQVTALEAKRVDAFGQLTGLLHSMRDGQEAVRSEAARLGNSLRAAPKASGRWGELHVKNVLEKCGLSEHYDYVAEQSVEAESGRLRPDFVVDVPGGRKIVIDAKNIWRSYDKALNAVDDEEKSKLLDEHAAVLRGHIKALSQKSYASEFEGSSDYVVLFIPGEHLLYAALEKDDGLWNLAFDNNVLLAPPTNLVAICRTVATVWQHEGLAQSAREIGKIGTNLYDSLAKTQDDIAKMGNALESAVARYNDFTKTYDSNVLSRARMLRDKHVAIKNREVSEEIRHIEAIPKIADRKLDRLVDTPDEEDAPSAA
jgi:DNA recombination protein RmuC